MPDLLFQHIQELLQVRPAGVSYVAGAAMHQLPTLTNAYLRVADGKIVDYGPMTDCPPANGARVIDATGRLLLPTWCDSHTHLVFAGSREGEFVDRIHGLTYQQIAERGGGILNSAQRLRATSEDDLYTAAATRLRALIRQGTGAIEIKSGYGLTVADELKMLRVIRRLRDAFPLPIRATFLGAHALPAAYTHNRAGYLDLLIHEALPQVAAAGLADYIDIFCEQGYFTVADTERLLAAGQQHGLAGKIHVNQFSALGGVAAGVRHGARSVDHLEQLAQADIDALRGSSTMPVALPGCSFFLGIPYTPADRLLAAGLPLALASDYNPGSAPSGNMNLVVALACIQMKLSPAAAINAATINGAYAMGVDATVGSISPGKLANLILTTPVPSYAYLPYAFGSDLVAEVYLRGEPVR